MTSSQGLHFQPYWICFENFVNLNCFFAVGLNVYSIYCLGSVEYVWLEHFSDLWFENGSLILSLNHLVI